MLCIQSIHHQHHQTNSFADKTNGFILFMNSCHTHRTGNPIQQDTISLIHRKTPFDCQFLCKHCYWLGRETDCTLQNYSSNNNNKQITTVKFQNIGKGLTLLEFSGNLRLLRKRLILWCVCEVLWRSFRCIYLVCVVSVVVLDHIFNKDNNSLKYE